MRGSGGRGGRFLPRCHKHLTNGGGYDIMGTMEEGECVRRQIIFNKENAMFQFEITGNVRNEQIILEDYVTQGGKKTKRAVVSVSTKTSGKFPSFLDIVVYGKLASNCAKYLKKGCIATFHVKAASPKGHPYEYHFVGTEAGFQTDYSLPIPSTPDAAEIVSDIVDDVFADL